MPCFHPIQAFNLGYKANGKLDIRFKVPDYAKGTNFPLPKINLPCGKCCGCRLERSRQWAVRCMHEASLYGVNNCYITLTFNQEAIDKHLPPGGGLFVVPWQKFMKRLRKEYGSGIRYFHCGEYGENFGRPHYHACLFNHRFNDRYFWKKQNGSKLYRSPSLEALWTDPDTGLSLGHSTVGDVTFNSAAYVARYIMKKVNGEQAKEHYAVFDVDDDAVITNRYDLKAEYITMSRRPGIAKHYFDVFHTDIYPHDKVLINNKITKPPRYYDTLYELLEPHEYETLKLMRAKNGEARAWDNTPDRLAVREEICLDKISKLKRYL